MLPIPVVTEQEVAVHLFAPLDGALAEQGRASIRGMLDRFRELQGADRPLGPHIPTGFPDALPDAPLHDFVTVAAVESAEGLDQAVLRRHHEILSLSLLLGAATDRAWPGLGQRLDDILGPLGPALLGGVVLTLGKSASGAAGSLDLSELGERDDMRALRRLRLLGRTGEDDRLGAWAWTVGGTTETPPFVRYLMHMAAIRYQLSVHRRLADGWTRDGSPPRALMRLPYGGASTALELTEPISQLRVIRHSVCASWDNARQALREGGGARGGELAGTAVLDDDENLVAWFIQALDDAIALIELTGGPQTPTAPAQPRSPKQGAAHRGGSPVDEEAPRAVAGVPPDRPVRVLAVADEWFPGQGGLSTFNRQLCIALAAAGADVLVLVVASTLRERADAAAAGVRLIDTAQPGHSGREALMRRPELPDGFVPDLIIGHGRVTGPAARAQSEDHFRGSERLHFLHVEPDQVEPRKPHSEGDVGARAEDRTELELELCRRAARCVPVGARLARMLLRQRSVPGYEDLPPALRIDPGFDTGPGTERVPPEGDPQILFMGRLRDEDVKGLDIACRALGRAVPERSRPGRWELLVRGAPPGTSGELTKKARAWISRPGVDVIVRPYSSELLRVHQDVARASLVLMPSRAEAFGLVGLEAVTMGVPVLVSGRSGLGMLLRETLSEDEAEGVVVDVDGSPEQLEADVARWERAIHSVMFDRRGAFVRATQLRKVMADRVTWGAAAAQILDCARTAEAP